MPEAEKIQSSTSIQNSADAGYTAFAENMRVMETLIRELKEIPELPSETPKEVTPLIKVDFPIEGGVLTTLEGHEYPYRGFPAGPFVDGIDVMKKFLRGFLSGLYHSLKNKNRLWFVTLLPAFWILRPLVRSQIYAFYRRIDRFKIKPNYYSKGVHAFYQAFSLPRDRERIETIEFRLMIRDLWCMILEFDNAYRFRVQDVFYEIDQQQIKTHTIKELKRLLKITLSRERTQEIKDTWTLGNLFLSFYLRLDKELKNIIADVFSKVNKEETILTAEDRHFCIKRTDYNFDFIAHPTREDKIILAKQKCDDDWIEEKRKIEEEGKKEILQMKESEREPVIKKYDALLKNAEEQYVVGKQDIIKQFTC